MTTQNTKDHTLYIRVPPVLKLAVSRAAAREGLSQNQYVQRILEQATVHDSVKLEMARKAYDGIDRSDAQLMRALGEHVEHGEPDF